MYRLNSKFERVFLEISQILAFASAVNVACLTVDKIVGLLGLVDISPSLDLDFYQG